MNYKKIALVLGFILIVVSIGFAIYWLFFRVAPTAPPIEPPINAPPIIPLPISPEGQPPITTPVTPGAELPSGAAPIADGGLTAVIPVVPMPTVGASLSSGGQLNYWNRIDRKFYRLAPDGEPIQLSNKEFFNVDNATFDPKGNTAIIEYPDGSNIHFDFESGEQVTLPKHWEEFSFNPSGDRVAAKSIGSDISNRYLIVTNPDGSSATAVQELAQNADKVIVNWSPNNQVIAFSKTGPSYGLGQDEIYLLGQNRENFKSLTTPGLMFQEQWSPSGKQLLFSCATSDNDWKPGLWVVDAYGNDIGKNRRNLGVDTWADKCVFADATTLYCAVPRELPRGAGLQPDVAADISDDIVKIDVNTGLQTRIAIPEGEHTIGKIMMMPDNKSLYFTDESSGSLNKVRLAP